MVFKRRDTPACSCPPTRPRKPSTREGDAMGAHGEGAAVDPSRETPGKGLANWLTAHTPPRAQPPQGALPPALLPVPWNWPLEHSDPCVTPSPFTRTECLILSEVAEVVLKPLGTRSYSTCWGASQPGRPSYTEGRPRGKGPPRRRPRSRGKRRPPEASTGWLAGNGAHGALGTRLVRSPGSSRKQGQRS